MPAGGGPAQASTSPQGGAQTAARPAPRFRVSPLRGGGVTPWPAATPGGAVGVAADAATSRGSATFADAGPAPLDPIGSVPAPDDMATFAPEREEPPLPEEAQAVAFRASAAPTEPREAPQAGILNVRFTRGADTARIVLAMEELRALFKNWPGATLRVTSSTAVSVPKRRVRPCV